jgi:hypothetical protein
MLHVWGGAGTEKNGKQQFDCSGYLYYVYFTSGVPVKRTTAYRMRLNLDNWEGKDINIYDVDDLDIPFWSWRNSPNRPFGHVGIILIGKKSKILEITHASGSKKKVVMHPLEGIFIRDLSAIRRLTIGEKKLIEGYLDELDKTKIIEPDLWNKFLKRVDGVNSNSLDGIVLPSNFNNYQDYCNFLLNTLKQETKDIFIKKINNRVSNFKDKDLFYKTIASSILNIDINLKYLQNINLKNDKTLKQNTISKWSNQND